MTLGTKPVIFISYAHADEPENPREGEVQWLSFVKTYLQAADPRRAVAIWVDRVMVGGDDINPEIGRKLAECDVFVLLVSPNSLISEYVVKKEIAVVRARQRNGQDVRFYPLILTATPKSGLKIVRDKNLRPRDGKPLSSFPLNDRQQHMAEAADEIVSIAKDIAARRKRLAPSAPDPRNRNEEPPSGDTRREAAPPVAVAPWLGVSTHVTAAAPLAAPSSLPPNPKMIGRKDRLDELVKAILEEDRPIVVPGALGMGKTTLALAAAYDPRVSERFGKSRRVFVNCEPAPDADDVLRRLATDLGLAASGAASEVEAKIAAACEAEPTLAILDNLETPWREDTPATKALLGRLASIERLRLVITVRGEPPRIPGPGARTLKDVEQLQDAEARALFMRHAGDHFGSDPALPGLIAALDGHPLSIELLAANAQGKKDLRGLVADWRDRLAGMLQHGEADDRRTSLRASLDLLLKSLRPPSAAHRLIRLMALLPDGMSEADSLSILSDGEPSREERGAAARLEDTRLASHSDGRWRLLAPVRETLLSVFPPEVEDRARLAKLFVARAALGRYAGTSRWGEVSEGLIAEAGNLDAMIGVSLREPELPEGVLEAVQGLTKLRRLTGLASAASLPAAADRFHDVGDGLGEANCLRSLGEVALDRSDHKEARKRYEAALPLYQKSGDGLGEANCIYGLGEIAFRRSDHAGARQRYEAALPLFQKVDSVLGEADCIKSLGDIALRCSDHDGAREHYESALPIYKQAGDMRGEANCFGGLGDIALERSDLDDAPRRYEAALALYQQVGDVLGEAICIARLGNVALRRSNLEDARQRYEAALPLYKRIGAVRGEANCVNGLGDIALRQSDYMEARERYETVLPLYRKLGDPIGEANCMLLLGDIALRRSDYTGARERYEAALPLYQKLGDPIGEANCMLLLGNIAFERSLHDEARQRYEAALRLYHKIDAMRGEANCMQRLGDVEEAEDDIPTAREHWREALALYARIAAVYSVGFTHHRLARRAATPEEATEHRQSARTAWQSIDRPDLIERYLDKDA